MDLDLSFIPTSFWRPDSISILDDKDAIYRFNRYWRILANRTLSKFLICKKILVDDYPKDDEDTMWEVHDRAMEEFKDLLSEKTDEEILKWYKNKQRPARSLLKLKRDLAWKILENCRFCERRCGVDRVHEQKGVCMLDKEARIDSMFIHIGEEPELVPSYTIFFSGCNFKCVYCQNWDISQQISGVYLSPIQTAMEIEEHYNRNEIRNVNWVGGSPTPNIHYILDVLMVLEANVPQIWNSNLYNSVEALKLLVGVIDLWLPDFKYGDNRCAIRLSKVSNYFDIISRNLKIINERKEEILIRHLVLPNHIECCTKPVLLWIKENMDISKVRINVMAQYHPEYRAMQYKEISHPLTSHEFAEAIKYAKDLGLPLTK